jgi:hypothetical protein
MWWSGFGLGLGQVKVPSAICPHGRDQDGCSAPEEDSVVVSDGLATPTFALAIHGFLDGGGLIQAPTNSPATDMAILSTVPQLRIHLCNLAPVLLPRVL